MLDLIKKLLKKQETQIEHIHDIQRVEMQENESIIQTESNPFLDNKLHLDYQMQRVIADNKSLRQQRVVLCVLLITSILGLVYLGNQTKIEAIVTMVDDKGQRIQPINLREMKDVDQRDKILSKTIEDMLINLRTVTPDRNLQYELAKKALNYVANDSQAYKLIINSLKESNPNSPYITGKKMMVTPVIKSVMKQNIILNNDKQKRSALVIEWRERVNDLNGSYIQTSEYKGTFIFDVIPPTTEAEITRNPFGIQVNTIQIVPVRIVDKAQDHQPLNSGLGEQNAQ